MAFSHGGKYVATAGKEKVIRIYRLHSGELYKQKSGSSLGI